MSRGPWLRIHLHLLPPFQELIIGQLALLEFDGFQQEEKALLCFIKAVKWKQDKRGQFEGILARFKKEFPGTDVSYGTSIVHDTNWNSRWERSIGIVEVTNHIIVKPSWRKLRKRDRGKIVLHIDPKMSFGTGHHETTRLCLLMLEQYIKKHARVLDVGAGTGILSIASAKLGAHKVVALDHDEWAVANARDNIRRNRVAHRVSIHQGSFKRLASGPFDLILSNIDLPTNLKFAPLLLSRLRRDGIIIFSGFLTQDLPLLLTTLARKRAGAIDIAEENEWVAAACTRIHAS